MRVDLDARIDVVEREWNMIRGVTPPKGKVWEAIDMDSGRAALGGDAHEAVLRLSEILVGEAMLRAGYRYERPSGKSDEGEA